MKLWSEEEEQRMGLWEEAAGWPHPQHCGQHACPQGCAKGTAAAAEQWGERLGTGEQMGKRASLPPICIAAYLN